MRRIVYLLGLYCFIAFNDNLRGILMPVVSKQFMLSSSASASFVTIGMLIFALFQVVGGELLDRFGLWQTQMVAVIVTGVGTGLLLFNQYPTFVLGTSLISLGTAAYNIIIAGYGPHALVDRGPTVMNGIGVGYTIAGVGVQLLAAWVLARRAPWQSLYMVLFVLSFAFLFGTKRLIRSWQVLGHKQTKGGIFKMPWRSVLVFSIAIACYSGAECAVSNWLPTYLEQLNIAVMQRGLLQSLFLLSRTVGLIAFIWLGMKLRLKTSIRLCLLVSVPLLTLGLLMGKDGSVILVLSGIGFSGIFPTLLVGISRIYSTTPMRTTGLILSVGYLLAALVNQAMAGISDWLGPSSVFTTLIGLLLIVGLINERINYD